jgi:ubiquitin-conjugating enzyme E2 Q
MIFTQSSEVPEGVDDALEALASVSVGMEVSDLITRISQRLRSVLATGSQAEPFHVDDSSDVVIVDDEGEELADGDDVDDNDDEDDQDYDVGFPSDDDGFADLRSLDAKKPTTSTYHISLESAAILNRRIREDLRAVKFAGFKLGILSGLKAESKTGILSISIRVSKLGLSEEVLQAWDLDLRKYLVLLVRYAGGYKSFQAVISEPTQSLDIQFRIGVCSKYKPTPLEALSAFTEVAKSTTNLYGDDISATHQGSGSTTGFNSLFISSSLNQLLNSLFIPLLKIRNYLGIGWDGAKLFHRHHQGRFEDASAPLSPEYYQESNPAEGILPEMMYADHLTDAKDKSISLPLVLTQFAMRYLVRCTQFCLVCHDRLTGEFEALKPYVCDKPLCLYQYMSLGFGPSIEHEILTQPFVVDLLVSFCYVATVVSGSHSVWLILRRA